MVFIAKDGMRNALCALVAAVWATSVLMSMFTAYRPDPAVNGVFSAMVGFLLTQGKDDDDDDSEAK